MAGNHREICFWSIWAESFSTSILWENDSLYMIYHGSELIHSIQAMVGRGTTNHKTIKTYELSKVNPSWRYLEMAYCDDER